MHNDEEPHCVLRTLTLCDGHLVWDALSRTHVTCWTRQVADARESEDPEGASLALWQRAWTVAHSEQALGSRAVTDRLRAAAERTETW